MHLNILFIFSFLILFHKTFSIELKDPIVSVLLKKIINQFNFLKDNEFISQLHPKCVDGLNLLVENAENKEKWALTMLDASVKFPNSIINSGLYFVGDMDLCFLSEKLSQGMMNTQYCLVQVPLNESFLIKTIKKEEVKIGSLMEDWHVLSTLRMNHFNGNGSVTWKNVQESYIFIKTVSSNLNEDNFFDEFSCLKKYCENKLEVWSELKSRSVSNNWCKIFAHFTKQLQALKIFRTNPSVTFALCLPRECSIKNITSIVDWYFHRLYMNDAVLTEDMCTNLNGSSFRIRDWVALFIFIIFGVIVVLSTTYDLISINNSDRKEIYKAFSWYSNGKRLLYGLDEAKEEYFTCIYGIRTLTIVWMLIGHWLIVKKDETNMNIFSFSYEREKSFLFTFMLSAFISVDIFILISGILIANGFLIVYNKYSFFTFKAFYLHRYLRTSPALAITILYSTSLLRHSSNGPTWKSFIRQQENFCEENWYLNLLYINNLIHPLQMCLRQTWYLSLDFQLFLISPIVLIPLAKYPRIGNILMVFFFFFGIWITFVINYFNQWDIGMFSSAGNYKNIMLYQYFSLHSHLSPWIIGIYIGNKIYTNKNKKVFFSKIQIFAFWTLSFVVMFGSVMALYPFLQRDYIPNILKSSLYISSSRAIFNLGIGWIIYACIYGYGGFINSFLSHPIFLTLGRLSYGIYLTHLFVQNIQLSSEWNVHYISIPNEIFNIVANFIVTLIPASIIYMTFEIPVANIEKYFFYKYLKQDEENLPLTKFSQE